MLASLLSAGASSSAVVFAVGGSCGSGFWRQSAPLSLLLRFPAVRWWAGGPSSSRLVWRLSGRSRALVRFVAASGPGCGLVAFVSGGPAVSPGSWGSVRAAVSAGVPVVVVPVGCSVACLPVLRGGGSWVPLPGVWAGGWRWLPASAQQRAAERDQRIEQRVEDEGPAYQFAVYPNRDGLAPTVTVFNPASGRDYHLIGNTCSCPDYRRHASEAGYRCKHLRAWIRRQLAIARKQTVAA